jgi:hypothetical protein
MAIFKCVSDMATTQVQVLKPYCSLAGNSLILIILKLKAVDADVDLVEFSRIKKDEPLESYSKITRPRALNIWHRLLKISVL